MAPKGNRHDSRENRTQAALEEAGVGVQAGLTYSAEHLARLALAAREMEAHADGLARAADRARLAALEFTRAMAKPTAA